MLSVMSIYHEVDVIIWTAPGLTTQLALRKHLTITASAWNADLIGAATVAGVPVADKAVGVVSSKCATASPDASMRGCAENAEMKPFTSTATIVPALSALVENTRKSVDRGCRANAAACAGDAMMTMSSVLPIDAMLVNSLPMSAFIAAVPPPVVAPRVVKPYKMPAGRTALAAVAENIEVSSVWLKSSLSS